MSTDHSSSLVATFKEKLRPRYYGKSAAANRYIKENVYFNGVALKESLLHDTECPADAQIPKRILFGGGVDGLNNGGTFSAHPNNNKRFELEKGCFIYQNPAGYCDDNDFAHKFSDMALYDELNIVNSNYKLHSQDTKTCTLVIQSISHSKFPFILMRI